MAKTKKMLAALLSAAMSLSVFPAGLSASAESDVTSILSAENPALAVWVKAQDGVKNGVWKNNGNRGDLKVAAASDKQTPEIDEEAINGYPAVKLRDSIGDATFYTLKYEEEYIGDSTVFMVTRLNQMEDYKGLYSTGDGVTRKTYGTYENQLWRWGKSDTYCYNTDGGEANRDRASSSDNDTYPTGQFMNYSYRVRQDGDKVKAKYQYVDANNANQSGEWDRGNVADNAFLKHTGFVLGARDDYDTSSWSTPYMDVAEVIVVLGTMSDDDVTAVRNYLDTKYYGSGYDPFAPLDYSTQKLPDQVDPNEMPLANDSRIALWIDGDSFDAAAAKWYDKSAAGNDMDIEGNISARVSDELNGKKVVHFPGDNQSAASVKLPEIYRGSSMIYFVYKPYKVNSAEAPDGYNYSYKGVYTTDYLPRHGSQLGRCGGIDVRHGSDGVELGFQSATKGQSLGDTPDVAYTNEANGVFAWNPGRTDVSNGGSSYYGYTRGFLDFELETLVGSDSTTMNIDFKDGEGSIPNINTGEEDKRGLNKNPKVSWDTTGDKAKADIHYGYTIGNRWDTNGTALLMDVAEMIVVQGELTAKEKNSISEYLKNKYYTASGSVSVPELFMAKDMTLHYINADGEAATNGVSEAVLMNVKGTLTNKYRDFDSNATAIAAVYENGALYALNMVDVTGISAAGGKFEINNLMLPADKSNLTVKIMAWSNMSDMSNGYVPEMNAVTANISVK
ncbi:MAG: hypothetical protein J6N52_10235 [Clostridia bacterium]|nr:hypothetical protein [Clostridia bacterium]